MLDRFKTEDEGFTLIELLVVILIIGILAAIALPSFLGQQKKGQDANAKANARNAVTQAESYFADENTYAGYNTAMLEAAGIPKTTFTGGADTFTIVATSDSGGTFTITKNANGTTSRTCSAASVGGCRSNSSW